MAATADLVCAKVMLCEEPKFGCHDEVHCPYTRSRGALELLQGDVQFVAADRRLRAKMRDAVALRSFAEHARERPVLFVGLFPYPVEEATEPVLLDGEHHSAVSRLARASPRCSEP
jgi:hypothetical protein